MTVDEARGLTKGDYILYRDLEYQVLDTKECRNAHTNEVYIQIKCRRQNITIWPSNEFVELVTGFKESKYGANVCKL